MKYKGKVYSLLLTWTTVTTFLSISQEQLTTAIGALGVGDFGQSLTESSCLDFVPQHVVGDEGKRRQECVVNSSMS